jgi:hypothetical protein
VSVRYIFSTSGEYVAFVKNGHLFTPDCEWIGTVGPGNQVFKSNGTYLGMILNDDRIVRSKTDLPKLPKLPALPPLRPLRPLPPLRRLRMPPLPYPYIDAFEGNEPPTMTLVSSSRVRGEFNGWDGDTIVELDNGERWQQARYKYKYSYRYRPQVKVWRSRGKYFMEVDGMEEKMEVRRA